MSEIYWCPGMTLADMEKDVIIKAMKHWNNKRKVVAPALGISIRSLHNKLKEYNYDQGSADEKAVTLETSKQIQSDNI